MKYFTVILAVIYLVQGWIDSRQKVKNVEGEEEIRRVIMPLILLSLLVVALLIDFIIDFFSS